MPLTSSAVTVFPAFGSFAEVQSGIPAIPAPRLAKSETRGRVAFTPHNLLKEAAKNQKPEMAMQGLSPWHRHFLFSSCFIPSIDCLIIL